MTGTATARGARLICGLFAIFIAALLWGGAAGAANEPVERFTLSPGDVLEVTVLEDPALTRQVLVRPDGKFSMPLAGTVNAYGRTPEEVQGTIRARLRDNFVEPPTVTVSVLSTAAAEDEEETERVVYVLGEVARPGRYEYDPDTRLTVLQALSIAGGPGPFAARARIQVREREGEGEVVRIFDYEAIETGAAADVAELADGAVLIVPERGFLE